MTKQVKKATANTDDTLVAVPAAVAPADTKSPSNLFISVKTFENVEGRSIGDRIVDMYHFGTRSWLQNHVWWAMHNGHSVEQNLATPDEIDTYLAAGKAALAEKFNKTVDAPQELEKAVA